MRSLQFRPRANADLDRIIDYYTQIAPEAVQRIAADIENALRHILDRPEMYAKIRGKTYRRYVSHRYRFKIAYRVTRNEVIVIGIWRFQNRTA